MKRVPVFLCCCITMVCSRYFRNINPYYYNQLSKEGTLQDTGRHLRLPHAGISSIFGNIHRPKLSEFNTPGINTARLPLLRHNLSLLFLASRMINPTAINPVMRAGQPMTARFQSARVAKNIIEKPIISTVTKKSTVPLPVIGFQSNVWVWPKGDVTGPLLGIPVKSDQQVPDNSI